MKEQNEERNEAPEKIDWYTVTINLLLGGALAMSFMMVGAYMALKLMQ